MSTLYRKYRPQRWADVAGQHHIKVTLAFEAQTGRLAHAYLFSGPRGTGKTTVARILARAINCTGRGEGVESGKRKAESEKEKGTSAPTLNSGLSTLHSANGEPCGKCANCLQIDGGAALDIIEMDAASHTGVDNVRDNIIENARFAPAQLKYKVFVIDEVHMLSTAAFNALLKTLEEPPARTVFILATTELHKVPATVASRCQRFDFRRIPFNETVERLHVVAIKEGKTVERRVLEEIARHADGGLRDAEGLLGKILSVADGPNVTYDQAAIVLPRSDEALVAAFVEALLRRDAAAAVTAVQGASDSGVDMDHFAAETVETLRRVLLSRLGASTDAYAADLDETRKERVEEWGRLADTGAIVTAIETLMEKRRELKGSQLPTLPLELAAARLCEGFSVVAKAEPPDSRCPAPRQLAVPGSASADSVKTPATAAVPPRPTPDSRLSTLNSPLSAPIQPAAPITTVEHLRANWQAFLMKAGEASSSLTFLLSVGEPVLVEGDCVHVAFGFAFHRDKFNDIRTREAVASALSAVLGRQAYVLGVLLDKNTGMRHNDSASARAVDAAETPKATVTPTAALEATDSFVSGFGGKRIA